MSRMFASPEVYYLTDARYRAGVGVLAAELAADPVDLVIGIGRGGTPVAEGLSAWLDRPNTAVSARHNDGNGTRQHATGRVTVDLENAAHGEHGRRLLLCDDIYGTGATARAVTTALEATVFPADIRTVTLCRNLGATGHPDLWLWDTDDWVVFPWEAPPPATARPLPPPPQPRRYP
ncbi:phosphoribosyltransferase [Amycolatopsis sp. NPDC059021]|uniref:phosphoribosyltransferase n=1 Tax=Amycolatopsis sp. NPDC059021 TaxID=3346704 RepID=UPI00366DE1EE